jgi:dihydropyrimidinase
MNKTLIINGLIATPTGPLQQDVAISGERIEAVGLLNPAKFPGYSIVDATAGIILPGGIDPHVHLALPTPAGNSADDFFSGSKAALAGGTTTIFDFVTPQRGQSLPDALHFRRKESENSIIDCRLHAGISEWNNVVAKDLIYCIENEHITSVKAYLAYRSSIGIDYGDLKAAMAVLAGTGVVLMVHCEDGDLISQNQKRLLQEGKTRPAYHARSRPPEAEIAAISRVIELAAQTGCAVYIVHISTRLGAELVKKAKQSGIKVFGETCPQYLLLDDSVYNLDKDDLKVLPYILSPPIRGREDHEGLWDALANGAIDVVATDHCPFNLYGQKDAGIADFSLIPNGAGGIEHRLGLLYTFGVCRERIGLYRFVELVSTRAAEIFCPMEKKGRIEKGYLADLVLWNRDQTSMISAKRHFSRCDSEIYEGIITTGHPEMVFLQGMVQNHNLHME